MTRDRESDVVERVANVLVDEDCACGADSYERMARAAIRETLMAMQEWKPYYELVVEDFAHSLSISLSPQEEKQ